MSGNPSRIALGNRRLLRLAKILDDADAKHKARGEPRYDQRTYLHECGSPSCALGHYAAATPKRWRFRYQNPCLPNLYTADSSMREFSLTFDENAELFAGEGCGNAKTAKQAARYIRKFVARRS